MPSLIGWREKDMESEESAGPIVPSTSRLSGKVRGLVARHPEETLNVLRRWMVDRAG